MGLSTSNSVAELKFNTRHHWSELRRARVEEESVVKLTVCAGTHTRRLRVQVWVTTYLANVRFGTQHNKQAIMLQTNSISSDGS